MRKTTKQADDLFELVTKLYFLTLKNPLALYNLFYFDPYDSISTADTVRQLLRKVLYFCGYTGKSLSDKVSVLSKAFLRAKAENITNEKDWYSIMDYSGGIYLYGRTYKISKKFKQIQSYEKKNKKSHIEYPINEIIHNVVNIRKTKKVYKGW